MTRTSPALVKLQPVLVVVVPLLVLAVMFSTFIQPRVRDGEAARARLAPLRQRAVQIQRTLAFGATSDRNSNDALREFDRRTPSTDRVSELVERLAHEALTGIGSEKARNLTIETGSRVAPPPAAGEVTPRVAESGSGGLDPRLGLFRKPLSYIPITIAFDASYERVGNFLWRLHGLPTLIEIRSVEIRSVVDSSFLHANLVIIAFQRDEPLLDRHSAVASAGVMRVRAGSYGTLVATGADPR